MLNCFLLVWWWYCIPCLFFYFLLLFTWIIKNLSSTKAWLAHLLQQATLDFRVVSSSPTMAAELTKTQNQPTNQKLTHQSLPKPVPLLITSAHEALILLNYPALDSLVNHLWPTSLIHYPHILSQSYMIFYLSHFEQSPPSYSPWCCCTSEPRWHFYQSLGM